jgi:hypothetical protein
VKLLLSVGDRLLEPHRLAASYGEALAARGEDTASLHAFDRAADLLPDDPADDRP